MEPWKLMVGSWVRRSGFLLGPSLFLWFRTVFFLWGSVCHTHSQWQNHHVGTRIFLIEEDFPPAVLLEGVCISILHVWHSTTFEWVHQGFLEHFDPCSDLAMFDNPFVLKRKMYQYLPWKSNHNFLYVGFQTTIILYGFIIFQKEPPFLKWWLTSRVSTSSPNLGNIIPENSPARSRTFRRPSRWWPWEPPCPLVATTNFGEKGGRHPDISMPRYTPENYKNHPIENWVVWVVATQIFFIFNPTWGNDPIWLIFFRWVETTN